MKKLEKLVIIPVWLVVLALVNAGQQADGFSLTSPVVYWGGQIVMMAIAIWLIASSHRLSARFEHFHPTYTVEMVVVGSVLYGLSFIASSWVYYVILLIGVGEAEYTRRRIYYR